MPLSGASANHATITLAQARRLQLAAQGLLQPVKRLARRQDLVAMVERMRLLQIDTIQVIARSPYLVLHARLGAFPMAWLDEALAQGRLAECWAHEACFVAASDIGLHRSAFAHRRHHWAYRNAERMYREQRTDMDRLLAGIRRNGPVRAADFSRRGEHDGTPGWWAWKPEKRWLEAWFALGKLMVSRRERFQRVYDLAETVLAGLDPAFDPATAQLPATLQRQRFIVDSVRALGVSPAAWIADYHRLRPAVTEQELAPLLASGELLDVSVQGWTSPGYVHRDHADRLASVRRGHLRATHTALLSPFDPLVWDRVRLRAMFDFDYALECYTPQARRRHGYFVLPILHRGALVGRMDAKAHRREGLFEIKSLRLESMPAPDAVLVKALAATIARFAGWHDTPEILLGRVQPAGLAKLLRAAWRAGAG